MPNIKDQFHRHCLLQKGDKRTTAWIPEHLSKQGKYLSLEKNNDEWEDGWLIIKVGMRQATKNMLEDAQDYKRTRKASDI